MRVLEQFFQGAATHRLVYLWTQKASHVGFEVDALDWWERWRNRFARRGLLCAWRSRKRRFLSRLGATLQARPARQKGFLVFGLVCVIHVTHLSAAPRNSVCCVAALFSSARAGNCSPHIRRPR